MNAIALFGRVVALTGGSIVTVFIALYALVRAENSLNREEQPGPIPMEAPEDLSLAADGDSRAGHVLLRIRPDRLIDPQ
jgi:hypothetical protein